MLDFNNTEIAFSAKSQSELKNAYLLFNTIKYPWLVKCASVVSNIALNIHFPLGWAVKPTLYKQFVGGETLQDCTKAIDHLRKFNVRSTLDFSAEGEQTPEGIQATFEETIRSIDFAKGNDNLAYAVFKPSTIITDELLAKVSEKQEELTIEEVKAYREFKERFMAFCQRAYDNDVRLIVDAEDYCFQDAIDSLTDEAMRRYNKKRAIDPKENAEHVMLVDLARNDLSRNAHDVQVDFYKEVQYYSHVIHLVSRVSGEIDADSNPIKTYIDTFPAGTLSGAPKVRAMQLITDIEKHNRGAYGGCIGFIGFDGDLNQAITIRTFVSRGNVLYYQAGAGIVAKSNDERELQEVNNKLGALKKAIDLATTFIN